jgi:hypothetical protein
MVDVPPGPFGRTRRLLSIYDIYTKVCVYMFSETSDQSHAPPC